MIKNLIQNIMLNKQWKKIYNKRGIEEKGLVSEYGRSERYNQRGIRNVSNT